MMCSRQKFFRQDQKLLTIKKNKLYFTKKFLLIKRYHQENERKQYCNKFNKGFKIEKQKENERDSLQN